jgi:hypothetical protein
MIMTLKKRIQSPTPNFFKTVQKWGILVAAIGGSILAAPAALPVILVKIGGYLAVAGAVTTAVSQAATGQDENIND